MAKVHGTTITVSEFDSVALEEGCSPLTTIYKYTLSNGWMEVDVIDYGATITAIRVPDYEGNISDVVLGYDSIKGYMASANNPYFGATIGRVANRIAGGKFFLDNAIHFLSKNDGEKTLHGGVAGFNKRLWKGCIRYDELVLELVSLHLDQGFPGELHVRAKFALTKMNELIITYSAISDRPTLVNMTNHSYFNLAGHETGSKELYEHNLMINANNFTPNDDSQVPIGKMQDVIDTVLDFTIHKNLGEAIRKTGDAIGIDINFCINGPHFARKLMSCLEHPGKGRRVIIYSNHPGMQLYTSNCLQVKPGKGKEGVGYDYHSGISLEPQNYPNAINQKNFPSCILRPSDEYVHVISYLFSTYKPPPPPRPEERDEFGSLIDTDYDFRLEEEGETSSSQKEDEKQCLSKVSKTDLSICQIGSVEFPDFTIGPRYYEEIFDYEPYCEIKPYEQCILDDFQALLKQCRTLASSAKHSHLIRPKTMKDTIYNILLNTELNQSRFNVINQEQTIPE